MEHVSTDKNKNMIQNIWNKNEAVFIIIVKRKVYLSICIMFIRLNWKTIFEPNRYDWRITDKQISYHPEETLRYCFKWNSCRTNYIVYIWNIWFLSILNDNCIFTRMLFLQIVGFRKISQICLDLHSDNKRLFLFKSLILVNHISRWFLGFNNC